MRVRTVPVTVSPSFMAAWRAWRRRAGLLFEDHAAIDDHVFIGDVELGDAAGDLGADQLFQLGGVLGSAAAGGHEGAHADIDRDAALADFSDGADDGQLLGEGGFEGRPVAGLRHFEARELVVVLRRCGR